MPTNAHSHPSKWSLSHLLSILTHSPPIYTPIYPAAHRSVHTAAHLPSHLITPTHIYSFMCHPLTYVNHSFIHPLLIHSTTHPSAYPYNQLPINLRLSTHPSTHLFDQPIKHPSKYPIDHLHTDPFIPPLSTQPSFLGTGST